MVRRTRRQLDPATAASEARHRPQSEQHAPGEVAAAPSDFEREQTRRRQAEALAWVARQLSGTPEHRPLLQCIARAARTLVGADLGVVAVPRDDGALEVTALSGHRSRRSRGLVLPIEDTLTGAAMRRGEALQSLDFQDDPGFRPDPRILKAARAEGVRSVLAVPVLGPEGLLSAIWAASRSERRFSDEDVRLLTQLAGMASAAVQNARLHDAVRRHAEEAAALERTGRLVAASLDLDSTLQAIAQAAHELTAADGAAFLLARPGGEGLEFRTAHGQQAEAMVGRLVRADDGVSTCAFRSRLAVRVDDAQASVGARLGIGALLEPPPRSLLSVPLISASGALGAVTVWHRQPRYFAARETRLLSTLADHAALAVEHARLYAESRRREREASLLADVSAVLHAGVEEDEALAAVCRLVGEALDASCAFVAPTPASGEPRLVAAHRVPPAARESLPGVLRALADRLDARLHREVFEEGQPTLLRDAAEGAMSAALGGAVPSSWYIVPSLGSAGPIGMLYVWAPSGPHLDEGHLRTLALVADRLGVGFENATLIREAAQVAALRELDRMKSELLDTVSHELRTPLSLIYGYAELMAKPELSGRFSHQDMVKMASQVHSGAEMMSRLVDDPMEYARLERGHLFLSIRPISLETLLEGELRAFQAQPGGERLRLALTADLEPLEADEARLRQVVGNLLSNALKYAPSGKIELRARQRHGLTAIAVRDHGPGIPDEDKPRVWDKFYRGRARQLAIRGSGIGLSVVRALVEAHGGTVSVEDTPGGGSTFRVELPTRRNSTQGAPARQASLAPVAAAS